MIRRYLIALLPLAAFAGLKLTEKPEGWQLTAGMKVTGYATYEDCLQAIRVLGPGDFKCKNVTAIKAEFTCDDEPMPALPTVVNAEGFTVRPAIVVNEKDGIWQPMQMEGFVKPLIPVYPNCWVLGLVPYKEDNFDEPQQANDLTPSPWVYGIDPEWKIGGKCPAQLNWLNDPRMCYAPPNMPIPPAP